MSIPRKIYDLGMAAYVKLHGFRISEIRRSAFVFPCNGDADLKRISELEIEYANSEFAQFDSYVRDLREMDETTVNCVDPRISIVDSIAAAAFLMLAKSGKWSIAGRIGKSSFAFDVNPEELELFVARKQAWPNSIMRDFNSEIMTIKALRRRHKP